MKQIAYNIKRIRESKGETQRTLAVKAGIVRLYVSHIEQGVRIPSVKVLSRIAEALDTKVMYLFEERTFNKGAQ